MCVDVVCLCVWSSCVCVCVWMLCVCVVCMWSSYVCVCVCVSQAKFTRLRASATQVVHTKPAAFTSGSLTM